MIMTLAVKVVLNLYTIHQSINKPLMFIITTTFELLSANIISLDHSKLALIDEMVTVLSPTNFLDWTKFKALADKLNFI